MYSPDGQLIIGSDGIPQVDKILKNLGNYGDDWMGGITHTLSYKRISLSFSFDARIGGKIIAPTNAIYGRAAATWALMQKTGKIGTAEKII